MTAFAPKEKLAIETHRVGRGREPVLVIDDLSLTPDALVEAAMRADWAAAAHGGYPGLQAPLPGAYVRTLVRRLDPAIRARLLPGPARLDRFDCAFSLVTRAPAALTRGQRLPHVDAADPWRVAVLHYLCGGRFGGTAFFRQMATGLERVAPQDREAWAEARRAEIADLPEAAVYPGEDTPGYARIGAVAACFDRVAIYRSFLLHSGIVAEPELLSDDPREGRLTANLFLTYAPT